MVEELSRRAKLSSGAELFYSYSTYRILCSGIPLTQFKNKSPEISDRIGNMNTDSVIFSEGSHYQTNQRVHIHILFINIIKKINDRAET